MSFLVSLMIMIYSQDFMPDNENESTGDEQGRRLTSLSLGGRMKHRLIGTDVKNVGPKVCKR